MPEKMSANRARDSRETVRRKRRERTKENLEFYECIRDIVSHPAVLEMKKYYQHCDTDCYEHCLDVAYNNYKICKKLGLDARSAARGGMLHDLFLYLKCHIIHRICCSIESMCSTHITCICILMMCNVFSLRNNNS